MTMENQERFFMKTNFSILVYQNIPIDRKSTRLNSSLVRISYAVFCLKKKNALMGLHNLLAIAVSFKGDLLLVVVDVLISVFFRVCGSTVLLNLIDRSSGMWYITAIAI